MTSCDSSPVFEDPAGPDGGMDIDIGQTTLTSFFATVRSAPGAGGKPGPQPAAGPAQRKGKPVVPDARRAAAVGAMEMASCTSASARYGALAPIPAGASATVSLMRRIDQAVACTELPLEISCCPLVAAQRRSYGVLVKRRVAAEIPSALLASLACYPEFSVDPSSSAAALFPEDRCPLDHHLVVRSAVEAVSAAARAFAKTAFLPKPMPPSSPEDDTPGTPIVTRPPGRETPIGTPLAASIWTGRPTTASPAAPEAAVEAVAACGGEERVGARRRGAAAVAPSEPASKRHKPKPRFRVTVSGAGGASSSSRTAAPKKEAAWTKSTLVARSGADMSSLASLKHEHFPTPSRACIALPFGLIKPTEASGGVTLSQVNEMVNAFRHAPGNPTQHAARRSPAAPCMMHLPVTPPECTSSVLKPRTALSTMAVGGEIDLSSLLCYEDLDGSRLPSAFSLPSQMDMENMYLSPREDMTFRGHMLPAHKNTLRSSRGGGSLLSGGNILLASPLASPGRQFMLPSPLPHATPAGAQGSTSTILSNFFAHSPLLLSPTTFPLEEHL